jgi:diguanylate cyclase (GGDEF)-like protein/PAS domain S-box-containing protein
MTRVRFLLVLCAILFAGGALAADNHGVNFGAADNVIALKTALTPYHAPAGPEADGSSWYMLTVTNDSVRPAARVLLAGQPPRLALGLMPRSMRPTILGIASSDSAVVVETATAYGRKAWRVIIPPVTTVGLALRVGAASSPPALYAWTEPALSSHNRQLAIFITAVAALIAAGAMITGGLAFLIGHAAPRWVSLTLFLLLFSWLSETGMFDTSLATHVGGPYGLSAFLTGLALAAGARLANAIIPLRDRWPQYEKLFHRTIYGLIALAFLAYLGVPGATLLTDICIVLGSLGVAAYLFLSGRRGMKAAQVIAPSAAAFALVAVAAAVIALGGLGESLTGPAATGGFAAAGAILLALAVIASEEIAVLPFLHGSGAAKLLEARAPQGAPDHAAPFANLALAAIGAAHQGVFDLDFRASLLTLSPESAQLLGLPAREATLSRADFQSQLHPDDRKVYVAALEDYRHKPGMAFRLEFRVRAPGGGWRWLELRATIVTDQDVPSDCLGLLSDITQRKEAEIEALAPRDPLTGLGNRAALLDHLAGLGREAPQSLVALLDIDRFKAIHASLGDSGADGILRQVADRIRQDFGERGALFRAGGDSFALVLTHPRATPQMIGDTLVKLCGRPYSVGTRSVFAPISVGLSPGLAGQKPEELLRNAEIALLAAKRQGGASAMLYAPEMEQLARADAVALETELRQALEDKQLDVFYQPIVRLSDRSVAGFEALLRWHHPLKGLIAPADFIAHSEETGLIVALGRFALARAADDLAHWQRYFPVSPPLFVSVNISPRQLREAGLESQIKSILAAGTIAPGTLSLEITESAAAGDPDMPMILGRLRGMGAGLAIDDFGTGTSTLSQFRHLPFDTVKVDRSFLVRHGGTDLDADGEMVLGSMIGLAHDLKRKVVVEGVESERDVTFLAGLGCEFAQGYFFAPALSAGEALTYIARHFDSAAPLPERS